MTRDARTAAQRRAATGLVAKTIRLRPEVWALLDDLCAGLTRSEWIEAEVERQAAELRELIQGGRK